MQKHHTAVSALCGSQAEQQLAAHKQHMRAVQPRLHKAQLAELGAQFAQRLQQQFVQSAPDAAGAVVVVDLGASGRSSSSASETSSCDDTPPPAVAAVPRRR